MYNDPRISSSFYMYGPCVCFCHNLLHNYQMDKHRVEYFEKQETEGMTAARKVSDHVMTTCFLRIIEWNFR